MDTITVADVGRFRHHMEGRRGYAKNTVNKRMQRAKQFWEFAIDAERLP